MKTGNETANYKSICSARKRFQTHDINEYTKKSREVNIMSAMEVDEVLDFIFLKFIKKCPTNTESL